MSNEGKILEEERDILKKEESLLDKLNNNVQRLAISLERARLDEYTSMLKRPWRFFFFNFIVGIFRGVGIAIGMTIVAAILIYVLVRVLRQMVDLPVIGMYIAEIVKFVSQYVQFGNPIR
ncbi:hypothetical protein A2291_07500 [candidate division WOR-1 bacterium RIFOXYB2_FULL_42_35]|uniref:Uncharacterized protein n=1 Tax=candidate division WOR-1 bacterium RIFOXYC2_FULL_41_25 TaxID=1802586 RepID=A0A1F4TKC0_UNCSA|nr:MAG: hypothetical protein A2247_04360 [candidate division WOR-1 bacterium RIFOXYA2_FULL_41_14]OGC22751.1 MAG: hypothetical protein A2291_07500 [candidate division WOR-1 bacterium RIFOXYB2_FULL_42_35]OGC33172.1 MAG: hypothetical protein A2462_06395 [candidate division WOR-1 bacterium RIFOXYC2_FULL_41_25]OGC42246.1 MAG: hypothetical protein A2548_05755 [candidate division WOR-1 bacterium RIFOXYD2_FULL_41_8]